MSWDWCEKCGKRHSARTMVEVLTARATHDSPAEWTRFCQACVPFDPCPHESYDEAYERAAARYDGSGKDWR